MYKLIDIFLLIGKTNYTLIQIAAKNKQK
jgi:hypothetical protein